MHASALLIAGALLASATAAPLSASSRRAPHAPRILSPLGNFVLRTETSAHPTGIESFNFSLLDGEVAGRATASVSLKNSSGTYVLKKGIKFDGYTANATVKVDVAKYVVGNYTLIAQDTSGAKVSQPFEIAPIQLGPHPNSISSPPYGYVLSAPGPPIPGATGKFDFALISPEDSLPATVDVVLKNSTASYVAAKINTKDRSQVKATVTISFDKFSYGKYTLIATDGKGASIAPSQPFSIESVSAQ